MSVNKVEIFKDLMKKREAIMTLLNFGYNLLPEFRKVEKEINKFVSENIVI